MSDVFDHNKADSKQDGSREEHAVNFVREFMEKSAEYREPHLELAKHARSLYECWSTQSKSQIQRANLKLPYAYTIIQNTLPQLVEVFLKEKPLFKFKGREPQDMRFEDQLTDFHSMQVDAMDFGPKFISFCQATLLDGTGFAKVPYRYQEAMVTRRVQQQEPLTGESYQTKVQELQVLFDGPDFEQIPFVDFFPDWTVKSPGNIKGMRGCAHRTWKTLSSLKASKGYKNLNQVEESVRQKGADAWERPYWSLDADSMDAFDDNKEGIKNSDLLEIWEYWGLYDPKDDGNFQEYIVTLVNGDVVIRCEENFYDAKFKPFVAAVNVPRDNEFYGISELLAVKGPIKEATVLRNARLDQTNLAVNRMWIADRASGIKANNLFVRPNGIIWTNDINGIKLLDVPEIPASSVREITELQQEIANTTGLAAGSPALSTAAKTFGRSATGAQLVQNIASSRTGIKARLIAELCIKRLAQIMFMTNGQFVTDPQWVRTNDPRYAAENPFTVMQPDAFHCQYDFEFTTALDGAPDDLSNYQAFMQMAQVAEQSQPGTIIWNEVFNIMGRKLLGREVGRVTRSDAERQQMMMQKLAMEQAANAMVGQNAPQPNGAGGQGNNA